MVNPFEGEATALRYHNGRPYHHERTLRRAFGLISVNRGRALDVACGTGLSTKALERLGFPAFGVDVSKPMLGVARSESQVQCALGAAEALPMRSASCAVVTVNSGVHWFDRVHFYREARRVLRPGGWLVLCDHGFLGEMHGVPAFSQWLRDSYLVKCPSPPRNPVVGEATEHIGFVSVADESFTESIPFTHPRLVEYLLTQSNALVAVERGSETVETFRERLINETANFFDDLNRPGSDGGSGYWIPTV